MSKLGRCQSVACLLVCAFALPALAGEAEPVKGDLQIQAAPVRKISFSPLPLDIYLQPNMKPVLAFTTPCIQIERATNGFPPIKAFEGFMFEMIGRVNDSEILPVKIEPVCI